MIIQSLWSFLVVISVIVVIHELGHYWMARLFGTKIDAFAVGFGPKLFGWVDKLGTQWKVCLLPLGGYVKFHGDATAASVPDREKLEELKKQVAAEGVDPNSILHFKPLYQRALIVFAGPLANFILAIVLLTGFLSVVGEPSYRVQIEKVVPGSPAERADLRVGDQILKVDGWKVFRSADLANHIRLLANQPVELVLRRGEQVIEAIVRPTVETITFSDGERDGKAKGGLIGIQMADQPESMVRTRHQVVDAAARGYEIIMLNLRTTFWYLGNVIRGDSKADMIGGPLKIAKYSGQVAESGAVNLIAFIALVSVSVGLINLFPIPVLDGGHLLFYAIEAIQGRPLSHRVQEIGFRIGLALIAALFVFVTWNDILHWSPVSQGSP